jgi:hypothetical protein
MVSAVRISCSATFPDQPGQSLRATEAGYHSQFDFRLTKSGSRGGQPQRARHRELASAAERIPVYRCDDWLAEVLDEIEYGLSTSGKQGRLRPRDAGDFLESERIPRKDVG